MRITLRTFGGFAVHRDGEPLATLPAHRLRCALLVYLALERETSRDALTTLLWPERDGERARHSLSQLLYELRQDLGDGWVETRGEIIAVTDALACDAVEFEAEVARGELESALRRYRGAFLEGAALHDAPAFEGWVETRRVHLARIHRQVRRVLVERLLERSDLEGALAVARAWAALEPLDDEAQHRTIELLFAAGERTEAMHRYAAYERALAAERLEPLEGTRQLIARVRAGERAGAGAADAHGAEEARELRPWQAAGPPEGGELGPGVAAAGASGAARERGSFLGELKRRQVFRVALGYGMVAFVVAEGATLLLPSLGLPDWTLTFVIALALLGFLPAVYLAWVFDITPEGVRRTDPERAGRSWARLFAVLTVAVLAALWLATRRDGPSAGSDVALDPARIAILPFEDHSQPPGLANLAAAFTQQLILQVGTVEGLTVLPFPSVRRFRDTDLPLDSIARVLGVGTIVTGGFVGTPDELEVRVELVDPLTMRSLAPLRARRELYDPLEALDALAGEAANFVRIHMGERLELERRRRQTRSAEAWQLVLAAEEARVEARGLAAFGDSIGGEAAYRSLRHADSLLALAERADRGWSEPTLLRGWLAAEAARLVELTTDPVDTDLYVERARGGLRHAERVLEQDPEDAAALELRGTLRYRAGRRRGGGEGEQLLELAEADLLAATELDAGRARAWQALSELHQMRGEHARARLTAEKALAADAFLDQADAVLYRLFNSALHVEEYAEATARCREGQVRFPQQPEFLMCELILRAFTEALPADLDTAWHLAWRERTLRPSTLLAERVPRQKLELAGIAARAGLPDSARALIRQGRLDAAGLPTVQIRLNYYEALVRLRLGERTAALDLLAKLVAAVPGAAETLSRDPWLAPLRRDGSLGAVLVDR